MTDEIKNKKLKKPQFPEVAVAKLKKFKKTNRTVDFENMTDEEWLEREIAIQEDMSIVADQNPTESPNPIDHSAIEIAEMLFKLGVRSDFTRNFNLEDDKIVSVEKMAPDRPVTTENMILDEFNDAALFAYVVARSESSPQLEAMLSAKYAKVSDFEVQSDPAPPAPSFALPKKAPRLWADRDKGTKAAQFLRENYAPWLEVGVLTRGALKACDKALYHAYHVWVHRHPEDAVTFKDAPPPNFIADPAEAIGRHRESVKHASVRYRARKAGGGDPEP